ncbi:MAG: gliding motility-associated C-terminal domain-containing protein, partial [Bacteroidota bacterium]
SFFWDFGTNEVADTSILENPTFTFPEVGDYLVTLIVTNLSGCTDTISELISVNVANQIGLQVDSLIVTCDATATITPGAALAVTYTYFNMFGDEIGSGPSLIVNVSGSQTILVVATDADGCTESQMVTIIGGPVDLSAPDTVLACGVNEINFGLVNEDLNDTLTYVWSPDSLFDPSTINDAEPVFTGDFGDYGVSVIATNQFGCADTADITLIVLDDTGQLDFEWEPDCSGFTIMFTNTSTVDFGFLWDFGGLGTSNEVNPSFTFGATGTYTVTLSTIYGDSCIASVSQEVTVTDVVLDAGINVANVDCGMGSVSVDFMADVLNETNDTLTYSWTFMDAVPATSNEENPTVVVSQSGDLAVSLTVVSEDSCVSSFDTIINVQLPQVSVLDSITICPGDSTELNPGFDPSLTYTWSPATDFDPNDPNPVVSTAGVYTVIVSTDAGDINCPGFDTIEIFIADSIIMTLSDPDGNIIPETVDNEVNADGSDVLPEVFTCGEEVPITANVIAGIDVQWTDFNGNPITTDNPAGFNPVLRDTVIAIASDIFGCTVADTVVIVNQQVDAQADPPSASVAVCATQDTFLGVINLDPNDTLTYAWEDNPIIISPLDSAYVIIVPDTEGTIQISVTVTNQFGCDTVIVFDVSVDPFISTSFPDTINACFDQPTELNPGGMAIAGYIYDWSPMNGDFSNPANPIVTVTMDQLYSVTITDPNTGCSETDSVQVIVAPDLMFTPLSTQDTSLCFPGDVTFMASAATNVVISWYDNIPFTPPPLSVGTNFTVSLIIDGQMETVYAEAIDTTTGCRDTLVFMAQLLEFDPNDFPDTVRACYDTPTELNPGAVPVDGYLYNWSPMDGDFSNPANPVVTLLADQLYGLTVTDPITGCELVDSILVIVAPDLMFEPTTTQDTALCFPDTVTFGTSHGPDIIVNWYDAIPFMPPPLSVSDSFDVVLTTDGQQITVYAEAVDTITGCRDTLVFMAELLEFNPNDFPDTVRTCYDTPTELNPGATPVDGYIYNWSPMDGDFSNPANPIVTLLANQTYNLTVTDPITGCELIDSIIVIVAPDLMLEPTTTQDTALCFPDTVTFGTNHGPDIIVNWYDAIPFMPPPLSVSDSFDVVLTTDGQQITVYAEAIDTLTGCRDTLVFMAELEFFDPPNYPDTIEACFGEPTPIVPDIPFDPSYDYDWTIDDFDGQGSPTGIFLDDTTIIVIVTDPVTGCFFEDTIFVNVSEEIALEIMPEDTILCLPDTITLTATNSANATVTWYDDEDLMNEIGSGMTIEVAMVEEGTITIYALAIEPEFGCRDTASTTVTLEILDDGLPAVNPQGCFGEDPVVLFPNGINPDYIYTFEPDDCVDLSDPANPLYICTESGGLTITVVNPETGCEVVTEVQVDIIDLTMLTGTATPDTIVLGDPTLLEVFGCEGDCMYDWMEPNGTIDPDGSTAVAIPDEDGTQIYIVEVTNSVCSEIVEIPVEVIDVMCVPERVYLPNAFSPNGDNINDRLRVRSEFITQIEEFELMIFNRWGQQMYRSFDPLGSWDGSFDGEQLPPDVYGYYLRVICPDGEELVQKGNITLLR